MTKVKKRKQVIRQLAAHIRAPWGQFYVKNYFANNNALANNLTWDPIASNLGLFGSLLIKEMLHGDPENWAK